MFHGVQLLWWLMCMLHETLFVEKHYKYWQNNLSHMLTRSSLFEWCLETPLRSLWTKAVRALRKRGDNPPHLGWFIRESDTDVNDCMKTLNAGTQALSLDAQRTRMCSHDEFACIRDTGCLWQSWNYWWNRLHIFTRGFLLWLGHWLIIVFGLG